MGKNAFINALFRLLGKSKNRPARIADEQPLPQQEDVLGSLTFRQALPADIPALARLHVTAWNDTYPEVQHKPTVELREYQWLEAFKTVDDSNWCCYLIEDDQDELIGFVQGNRYKGELPGFEGQLNKIYLLQQYQRMGLGRKLVGYLARGLLSRGMYSMLLFAESNNPACRFYEVLGGEKLLGEDGQFHGTYGWRDLEKLSAECPISGTVLLSAR